MILSLFDVHENVIHGYFNHSNIISGEIHFNLADSTSFDLPIVVRKDTSVENGGSKDYKLRKGKDLRDLQELLERNHGKITEADLRSMCAKYACPEVFDKLSL